MDGGVIGGVCAVNWGEEGDVVELGTGAAQTGRPGAGAAGADRQGAGDRVASFGGGVRRREGYNSTWRGSWVHAVG